MRANLRRLRAFTLIELMIVVAIVGVLAALAVYGVRRYLLDAKTAEARNSLGQLSKDAKTAYERETMSANVLAAQGTAGNSNALCGNSTAVPTAITTVSGKKYQSAPTDWVSGDQTAGWQCLKFSMSDPQYYMYQYRSASNTFTAQANGDLDGNGLSSTFAIYGSVYSGAVFVSPNIYENAGDQ